MKAIATTLHDRVVLALTAFSGLMFFACLFLMMNSYRPLLQQSAEIASLNQKIYNDMRSEYREVEASLKNVPSMISFSFTEKSAKAVNPFVMKGAVEELVQFGSTLIMSER